MFVARVLPVGSRLARWLKSAEFGQTKWREVSRVVRSKPRAILTAVVSTLTGSLTFGP